MVLNDICDLIVDCPHTTSPDMGKGYPLIRTPNIGKGRFLLDGVHRVSEKTYNDRNARAIPQEDDLIFAREAPAGNVAIIKNEEKFCLGQRTVLVRPNEERVIPDYLVYYLLAPQQQHNLLATANGATVPHVNLSTIRGMEVSLPPLPVQRRIADILSAYDDLIENNQKQIKLLEEAAMRLYKEWFVYLRFPGHENTPIVDGVPEGWMFADIKDLGEVVTGKTPPTSKSEYYGGNIPFVKIPDMHDVIYPLKTESKLSETGANTQKNKFLPCNSIMVSCIATVGLVCIACETCQTNQQINALVLNDENYLFYMYFKLRGIKALLEGVGSNGATMTNVNKKKFENIKILVPADELIINYKLCVESFFKKIYLLSKQNLMLIEARDKLLPKLMSGEIEV